MTRIITLASGKGGVGKTSITANLGIALAQQGQRVLLVDADVAMANLSLLLGMQSSPITLHDVLLGEANSQDSIYDGPEGINFIPSGLSLESYKRVDSERLEAIISEVASNYDYVLLDAAAGIEKNVKDAFSASKETILITTPDSPSVADVLKTKMVSERLNSKPIGAIINCVRGERGEIDSEDIMKMLELPVYGKIPYDPEVRRSFMQENVQPVILRKPNAPAVIEFKRIAMKLTGKKTPLKEKKESTVKGIFEKIAAIFGRKKEA